MQRKFYDLVDPALAPRLENRVFPDPGIARPIGRLIAERGGVDACFGGIGINGHIAFNEPPEPGQACSVEAFAALPTRVLDLSRETRTINSVTVGGELSVVPRRAVTVGMREILAARRLCFYCNRPWQQAVVRRVLHGPLTAACPASLLRTHADAAVTVADFVADGPGYSVEVNWTRTMHLNFSAETRAGRRGPSRRCGVPLRRDAGPGQGRGAALASLCSARARRGSRRRRWPIWPPRGGGR